jgi:L-histidine N-alpha-methyltransferase
VAPTDPPVVDVYLHPEDLAAGLAADVEAGLTSRPKHLSPKWLYDPRGCDLFEQICELPEYYPTRAECSILAGRAGELADLTGATTLVELGSGASDKTRLLLDALVERGSLERFVGFDVAEPTLRAALADLATRYPGVAMAGVVGDFEVHLDRIPEGDGRLVAFLGGTIGNLEPLARMDFLAILGKVLHPGEWFLVGTDLVKDPARLVAAYDDAAGVTAAFDRNILAILNRELEADFDLEAFSHVARWDAEEEWIEMRLRSARAQVVTLRRIDLAVEFGAGEELRTEVSAKFRLEGIAGELAAAGFATVAQWTDPHGDFALTLTRREDR